MEDFKKWASLEETSWRQKSRELWLKEGDKNNGLFHGMANSLRIKNSISRIRIQSAWVEGIEEVRVRIANAFQDLLLDSGEWKASIEAISFSLLSE